APAIAPVAVAVQVGARARVVRAVPAAAPVMPAPVVAVAVIVLPVAQLADDVHAQRLTEDRQGHGGAHVVISAPVVVTVMPPVVSLQAMAAVADALAAIAVATPVGARPAAILDRRQGLGGRTGRRRRRVQRAGG